MFLPWLFIWSCVFLLYYCYLYIAIYIFHISCYVGFLILQTIKHISSFGLIAQWLERVVGSNPKQIPEDACSFRQYGWRFDSIELKQVTKVLKIQYQKVSTFLQLSQRVSFDLLIFFLLGIGRNVRLDFGFPSNFTDSYCKQLDHVWFTCFTCLFQILDKWLLLLQWNIATLAGQNSLINLLILRILTSLGLLFNHEFYYRLLAAGFD